MQLNSESKTLIGKGPEMVAPTVSIAMPTVPMDAAIRVGSFEACVAAYNVKKGQRSEWFHSSRIGRKKT